MLYVRNGQSADFDRLMEIYRYAQDFMIRTGNPTQWAHEYPAPWLIQSDIRDGVSRVICDETGKIRGAFALFSGAEPSYKYIEGGAWLNDEPYLTIHRMAGGGEVHGLFRCAADHCKRLSQNIRIDTHADNKVMQRRIEENGFVKCGTIYVSDGTARIAYQWTAPSPSAADAAATSPGGRGK